MARCEDFPCCGHESGCCPDYRNGVQQNMKCVCGATVPLSSRSSICKGCLSHDEDGNYIGDGEEPDEGEDGYDESMDGDHADALESVYGDEDRYEHDDPMSYED